MRRILLIGGPPRGSEPFARLVAGAADAELDLEAVTTMAAGLRAIPHADCVMLWPESGDPVQTLHDLDDLVAVSSGTPIIVITGADEADSGMQFVRRGAQDHLRDSDLGNGRLTRCIALAIARSETDAVLRHSEQQHRTIVEALGEGVVVQNADGKILSMNRRAEEIFAAPDGQALGLHYVEAGWAPRDTNGRVLSPDERPGYRCFTSGEPVRNKVVSFDVPNGATRWLDTSSFPLRSADDAPLTGVVTILTDVTEQRAASESVRFEGLLLDAVGQSVIATDLEGRILYWNLAATAMFGWSADEAVGRNVMDVTVFDDDREAARIMALLTDGQSWTGDFWARRRDGTRFPILLTGTPIIDDRGKVTGIVGVSTDITERLRTEEKARRMSSIVEASTNAIFSVGLDGRITSWNDGARSLLGYTEDEAVGAHVSMLAVPERAAESASKLERIRAGERGPAFDTIRRRKDGSAVEVSVIASPVFDDAGHVVAMAGVVSDITERKVLERALAQDRARLAEAQRIARFGSFDFDAITGDLVWSAELYRILGVDATRPPCDDTYLDAVHPDDRAAVANTMQHAIVGGEPVQVEHRIVMPNAAVRWVSVHAERTADDRVIGVVLDITDTKNAHDALTHLALHDRLTDLPNLTMLERKLNAVIAGDRGGVPALFHVNIDRFKAINDAMGHGAGDELLAAVAARLSRWAGPNDTVVRLGGDEFVVLCEDAGSIEQTSNRGGEILHLFASPFELGERQVTITASIGVASVADCSSTAEVLRHASAAMRRAKERGRDRVLVADAELCDQSNSRRELEAELRAALTRDEFRLHYQPVVDLATQKVVGYEALIRWDHPQRGLVGPDEFIGLAEETGLIVPIGRWVLNTAMRELAAWRSQTSEMDEIYLAVNVSTVQLYTADIIDDVAAALLATGIDARSLHLEVTETALIDIERATTRLVALKATGVHIELDDFGTGYSSLSYLQRLPIDKVKIDRSFCVDLEDDDQNFWIVAAIISLGHAMGMTVLAEGVRTIAQRDNLYRLGCDLGQGYLWSPAMPAEEVIGYHSAAHRRHTIARPAQSPAAPEITAFSAALAHNRQFDPTQRIVAASGLAAEAQPITRRWARDANWSARPNR